jgi:hypothetical protein
MQGTHFPITIHVPGTLAANVSAAFQFPFDVQLVQVSAGASNANNGIIDIGPSTDTDGYLDAKDIGDSAPAVFDKPSDFVSSVFPHIVAGTIITVSLDYDGAGGTAAANFTAVLIFTEG